MSLSSSSSNYNSIHAGVRIHRGVKLNINALSFEHINFSLRWGQVLDKIRYTCIIIREISYNIL